MEAFAPPVKMRSRGVEVLTVQHFLARLDAGTL